MNPSLNQKTHIMIITGEPSGDFHAGRLVKEIKRKSDHIYFSGIGGQVLKQEGVDLFYAIEKLSAMGITEVLMQIRNIKNAFDLLRQKIWNNRPDLIILVDYPGFNLRVAQYVKEHWPIKILYYITPKVWAWKKSRLSKIKKYVDHAAIIFPFEEKLYKKAGIPFTYVGNPLMADYSETFSASQFHKRTLLHQEGNPIIIGLFPGSRVAEIKKLSDVMIQAAILIHQKLKCVRFVISKADSVDIEWIEQSIQKSSHPELFEIVSGPVSRIFNQCHIAVAASGTVTLEAALLCVPTVLVYKMSSVSFFAARWLVKVKYAGLANLIANEEVMPELLQDKATPFEICNKALFVLDNESSYRSKLDLVRKKLNKKNASQSTASLVIQLVK